MEKFNANLLIKNSGTNYTYIIRPPIFDSYGHLRDSNGLIGIGFVKEYSRQKITTNWKHLGFFGEKKV